MSNKAVIQDSLLLKSQTVAPSNPTEGEIYNDATEGLLVYKEGEFQPVGSGSGTGGSGGVNFLTLDSTFLATKPQNSDFEASIGDYVAYADAAGTQPVDGTGGSPNVTIAQTTSSPLNGEASALLTKDAANRQGQGVSCAFPVPLAYRNRRNSIIFPYSISGTYVAGALSVWVYDVTNSVLLNCGNNIINTSSGMIQMYADFNSGSSYRFIIHVAGTDTNAYTLKFDDVQVSPQEVINGAEIGNWNSNLSFSYSGVGTVLNNEVITKLVGDTLKVRGSATCGTVAGTTFSINLPTGYDIDTAKMNTTSTRRIVGSIHRITNAGAWAASGTGPYPLFFDGSVTNQIFGSAVAASFTALQKTNGSGFFATSDSFSFEFEIPVVNRSSNINLSNSSTFRIAPILANGTRVTGSAPTQLGQYRSYLRNASSRSSFTETNGTPGTLPTSANGILLYGGNAFNANDSNNEPSRYEIYIGRNFNLVQPIFFSTTGLTGNVNTDPIPSTGADFGLMSYYDKVTGILSITANRFTGGTATHDCGLDRDGSAVHDVYFDVLVSENAQAVGLDVNNIPLKNTVYIKDVKTAGTDGGTFTSGAWQTRTLNTLENPFSVSWVSLGSNQITLAPGTYQVEAEAPAYDCEFHKAKLANITATSDTLIGSSFYCNGAGNVFGNSKVLGAFTIGSTTVFEIQHRCTTTVATNGFGPATNVGVIEVYTQVKITKLN